MKGLKGLQCLADPPLAADPARPRAPVTQAAPEAANREPAMPPRSLRTAALSFGLVTIPVRFYTAPSSQSPHFHLIHEQCGSRIKQQLFCPTCGRVVEPNELLIREPMARLIRLTVKAATNTDREGADDGEHPEAEDGAATTAGWTTSTGRGSAAPLPLRLASREAVGSKGKA